GIFAAWLHLTAVSDLWTTPYGRTLLLKLVLLLGVFGTGAYNWLRVKPSLGGEEAAAHLRRSAAAELGIGVIVLAVTAMLVATPLPATPIQTRAHPGAVNPARSDSASVAATVERFHHALAMRDSAAALRLLSPDAVVLESGGAETRAEYRAHHLPADVAFAQQVETERGPVRVRVNGNTAWATSLSTTTGEYEGHTIRSQGVELMVLSRRAEEWAIEAIHWSSRRRAP
ncbi:MAG TPA: CopD family protein, partial [Longimicrobiaceae bacterium]|nr:CopD family protein [Longimicrobiaceae bacterium]